MLGLGNTLSGGIVPAVAATPFSNTYSIDFDGTNDYMVSDSNVVFTETGSYAFWMKTSTRAQMVALYASSAFYFYATISGSDVVPFIAHPAVGSITSSTKLDDGAWHFITVTTAGSADSGVSSTVTLYVDGSSVATGTVTGSYTPVTAKWELGHYGDGPCCRYTGNLDEVAMWNVTLDANAITQLYNSGEPIDLSSDSGNYDNSGDLVHWWRMGDGDTFTTITDNKGSNDMEMTNMASGDIEEDVPSA